MKTRFLFFAYRVGAIGLSGVAALAASQLNGELKYIEILSSLIGVAGVVITVFGIWVAVIFPRFVQTLSAGEGLGENPDHLRYQAIMGSLYRASFDLCACLVTLILLLTATSMTPTLRAAFVFFAAMCAISLGEALASSIVSGDRSSSDSINAGIRKGMMGRRRRVR